jgi:hypothetical protein
MGYWLVKIIRSLTETCSKVNVRDIETEKPRRKGLIPARSRTRLKARSVRTLYRFLNRPIIRCANNSISSTERLISRLDGGEPYQFAPPSL